MFLQESITFNINVSKSSEVRMGNCLRRLSYSLLNLSFISDPVSGLHFFSLADVTQEMNALSTFVKIQSFVVFLLSIVISHVIAKIQAKIRNKNSIIPIG